MPIVQLVPRLRPASCGIGDYAVALFDEWRDKWGCGTEFIVADPLWKPVDGQMQSSCSVIKARNSGALIDSWGGRSDKKLLLHYSGYGYAKRGAPVWLVRALRQFRKARPDVPIISMVHELFAFGPPNTSAFWLCPIQRWVTIQVARLSDAVVTNRQNSAAWLEAQAPKHRGLAHALPVFSNLGEMQSPQPPSQRPNHLVLFGYHFEFWGRDWQRLTDLLRLMNPERITLLGKASQIPAEVFGSVQLDRPGWLKPEVVSAILASARYGLLAYDPAYLGKSGILAAFLAHGVVPLLVGGDKPLSEGLERGTHLLDISDASPNLPLEQLDAISSSGLKWYRNHRRFHAAALFAAL